MEWKILEKNIARKVEWNRSGKGMEQERRNRNRMVMERKKKDKPTRSKIYWNGTEMERKWNGDIISKIIYKNGPGSGMEWEWKRNGI